MNMDRPEEEAGPTGAGNTERIVVPIAPAQTARPHLIVVSGQEVGLVFRISRRETTVGRSADAGVRLSAESVSRRHAVIKLTDDHMTIEDLGSKNGTFVGVDRVKQAHQIRDGDEVTLGTVVLLKLTYSTALEGIFRRVAFETAGRDPATQISNTPYLADRLRSEHAFARRHQQPLSLIFSRVDGVASLREPGATDMTTRAVAAVVRASIRTEDALASVADDELVALIRADARGAEAMMNRVRARVRRECRVPTAGSPPATMTVVIMPLESSIVRRPETIIMAARERARLTIGNRADCLVHLPALESDRAPRRDVP